MSKTTYREFRDFGPCPWWVWNGKMIRSEMLRQMDALKNAGIDEFFIYGEQGLSLPFLEEGWFKEVEWAIGEAKKRNMHVWIYDDLNWPSGTANGFMVHDHPEYRSRSLNGGVRKLPAGEPFFFNDTAKLEGVYIRRDPKGNWEPIQLDDNFMWVNNTGKEVEVFHVFLRYYNNAMMCSCDADNSQAYRGYCDLLNPDAVKCWMGYIHEQYYKRFPQEFGKTVRGFFFDEPFTMHYIYSGYQCLPWTPGIYEKFQKRYGYDFREWLPELFTAVNNTTNPKAEKVRVDYWKLLSDLSADAFSKTIADWCAKHHVQSTGHLVGEECQVDGRFRMLFNGSIWKHQSKHQIPGMDLLTDNTPYHLDGTAHWYGADPNFRRIFSLTAKQPCSSARYTGAKRVMAEAMGVNSANTALNREKVSWDWLAGCGVSMLNDNSFGYTMAGYHKDALGNKYWTQPWFKHYGIFSEYIRIMSRFASENYLDAETCVLVSDASIYATVPAGFDQPIAEGDRFSEPLMAIFEALVKDHVEFELMWDEVLLDAKISKGALMAPNSAFKTIIIPQMAYVDPAIAKKLDAFAKAGGQLVFVGCRPSRGPEKMPDFSKCPLLLNTDKEFNKQLTSLIKERPYWLKGAGVDMVFAAKRGKTLLLSNQGEKRVSFELKTTLPKPWKAISPGDNENVWNFEGNKVVLEPEQSILLEGGVKATGKAPVSYNFPLKGKALAPKEWNYELTADNNARPCFEIGLAPNRQDLKDVKCWVPCGRDGRHGLDFSPEECPEYWARATFDAKVIPEKLLLVVDTEYYDKVILNGKVFTKPKSYELWDWCNYAFDIASAVKKGKNTIVVHIITSPHARREVSIYHSNEMLQPLVLHGTFGVEYNDAKRETVLTALPKTLKLGDLTTQGLPSYLGEVILKTKVQGDKPKAVLLPDVSTGANSVAVNGKLLGTRLWSPYIYDTAKATWKKGDNEIAITICSNLGQLLKRRYGCNRFIEKPYGLFAAPVLL